MAASHRWVLVAIALSMLFALAGGAWFYNAQERQLREDAEASLQTIARLKTDQITALRAGQLADASVIMASPYLLEGMVEWLASSRPEDTAKLMARLGAQQRYYGYSDILVVDANARVRLRLNGQPVSLPEDMEQAIAAAFTEKRAVLTDLHIGPDGPAPHLDVVAPFFATNGESTAPLGAVILRRDAQVYLYPVVESWPAPSRTAETLLVRRDGDAVLFLNELRHQPDTALRLRIPLSETNVPAVMAVLGREGVFQGKDYRGVEVLSVVKSIPDSPWYMVAKVDADEALAVWRQGSMLIVALVSVLGLACVASAGAVWQRGNQAHSTTGLSSRQSRHGDGARNATASLSTAWATA